MIKVGSRRNESSVKPHCEHVLVTLLGTGQRQASYVLGEHQVDSRLAPVALYNLLPAGDRPDRVLALCTSEARRKTWPHLQESLGAECPVECSIVPAGHTEEDVRNYLLALAAEMSKRESVDITVDITHGFRHFSILTYTAVLYLEALGIARVRGAYYGLLGGPKEISPFLDLRPLLALPQWIYAVRVFHDTGSAMPMADALGERTDIQQVKGRLRDLSEAYLSGLPLELGRCASDILDSMTMKPLRRFLVGEQRLPLADELINQIKDGLRPVVFVSPPSKRKGWGQGWKARVPLSKGELERQASVVDDLLRRGSIATGFRLMSEWTISWAVWRSNRQADWLDFHKARRRAGNLLGAIRELRRDPELKATLSRDQKKLGEFWDHLSTLRNAYAHNGMRRESMLDEGVRYRIAEVTEVWKVLRRFPDWGVTLSGSGGRVLLSPIGMRPGVLFSALEVCRGAGSESAPSVCLVICSQDTEALIEDVARQAGFDGRIERIRINPYGNRQDIREAVRAGRRHIVGADQVWVNVTGGTTVMGLAAEALATEAKHFACPVRRFGLIDRKPSAEQDADPYRVGDPIWLDGEQDADVNGD